MKFNKFQKVIVISQLDKLLNLDLLKRVLKSLKYSTEHNHDVRRSKRGQKYSIDPKTYIFETFENIVVTS